MSRTTVEARNGLLRALLVRRGAMEPWDRRACNGATTGDLDLLALRDALQRIGIYAVDQGVEPYLAPGVQLSPFVPSLCIAEPLTSLVRPRNFAILLFGRMPQRFIPGGSPSRPAIPAPIGASRRHAAWRSRARSSTSRGASRRSSTPRR